MWRGVEEDIAWEKEYGEEWKMMLAKKEDVDSSGRRGWLRNLRECGEDRVEDVGCMRKRKRRELREKLLAVLL